MPELTTLSAVDDNERPVEEVRCTYTGVPIPTIPSWYAGVKVKFFSEASRKTASTISLAELEAGRLRGDGDGDDDDTSDLDADLELDDVDADLEIEDDTEDIEPDVSL